MQPKQQVEKEIDTDKLRDPAISESFQEALQHRLISDPTNETSIDAEWTFLRNAINEPAEEAIGYCRRRDQGWFSTNNTEVTALIDSKRNARTAPRKSLYLTPRIPGSMQQLKDECQTKLQEI